MMTVVGTAVQMTTETRVTTVVTMIIMAMVTKVAAMTSDRDSDEGHRVH